jgi:predicted nucleic acid-binding Zn ribbon protein
MPIYVYETTGKKPRRFELKQSMNDAPLKHDPETGEPVRRVISGGYGFIEKGKPGAAPMAGKSSGGSCGSGCGCH